MEQVYIAVIGVITSIGGYFAGRRKRRYEYENQELKNLQLAMNIYIEIINNLKDEVKHLNGKIEDLEALVEELIQENKKLKNQSL